MNALASLCYRCTLAVEDGPTRARLQSELAALAGVAWYVAPGVDREPQAQPEPQVIGSIEPAEARGREA